MSDNNNEFEHNGERCFNVRVPNIGASKAVYYDLVSLKACINYIKDKNIKNPIVYVLACRIGPFIGQYWKMSERLMVKHADLLICNSINIEKYIKEDYKMYDPKTTFITYGADVEKSKLTDDEILLNWYEEKGIKSKEYYLVVGRFVPENNYETMITEFMKSNTKKDFVLITNVEKNKFYEELKKKTGFDRDKRIKFVGTVYEEELLKKIRENTYGYFHGHEVGGTNPSLLESLAITDLNLLLDVGFNNEVTEDSAFYWNKVNNSLSNLLDKIEKIRKDELKKCSEKSKKRVRDFYSWKLIVRKYEDLFIDNEW